MKILVTGAGGASGLATIRILKETTQHVVFGADCSENAAGLYLADEAFIIPRANDSRFIEFVSKIVTENDIDLILPNVDDELEAFALHTSTLPQALVSSIQTIKICSDKLQTLTSLQGVCGIPKIYHNEEPPINEYPVLVKPRCSRGSRNIYVANNSEQLCAILSYVDTLGIDKQKRLVLEYLPGDEYTVDCMFDVDGTFVTAVPRKRIATHGSVCSVGAAEKNKTLISLVKKISSKLDFKGPINIQFRKDKSGHFKLLEINPRIAGATSISLKCGVNIPRLSLNVLNREPFLPHDLKFEEKKIFRYLAEV